MPRYHVSLGARRTTVSLDTALSDYLALRLDTEPQSKAAHKAVRDWLQAQLDAQNDPGRCFTSQWLQSEVVHEIADRMLREKWGQWFDRATPMRIT